PRSRRVDDIVLDELIAPPVELRNGGFGVVYIVVADHDRRATVDLNPVGVATVRARLSDVHDLVVLNDHRLTDLYAIGTATIDHRVLYSHAGVSGSVCH